MSESQGNESSVRWQIPLRPRGRKMIADFFTAPEETQAKFRELYPVSFNSEMAEWFGIGVNAVAHIGHVQLGLHKDLTLITKRRQIKYGQDIGGVIKRIRSTNPERYADIIRRVSETMRKKWRKAYLQQTYGLERTTRLHTRLLPKKMATFRSRMTYSFNYFSDSGHPYWICYDSQTKRSPSMEAKAIGMGFKIVEGEG